MLWSFATLKYSPLGGKFVRVAHQRLLPLCPTMDSSDVTKILTALAKMKVRAPINRPSRLWVKLPNACGR